MELFEGSIKDLENMTGRAYEAMVTENGELVKVHAKNIGYGNYFPLWIRRTLEENAQEVKADALVHVTYVTGPVVSPPDAPPCHFYCWGYAVKIKK